ncbi:MAG: ABC transporter ATP-binding protein [Phycisphaeraceae bacterium]|nr:ABC transporter ATP-binding protein [Phycisphaeraceae bacterium]|tara:strand:- start:614 stop:1507 length:894 start_codon:yes stop_codon:yes gene_type:complete
MLTSAIDSGSTSAICVRKLVKRFDGNTVLDGIDLEVFEGETMVVMGGSGSGKSTLLRHMIGSLRPDEGTIELLGTQITGINEKQLNDLRKKIGILFQSGALFNSMTLRENVALPLTEHTQLDPTTIDIMVKIKLELVGLREHAEKYPAQISGGMKKRAGLARALALDPRILFYDEPSAGLDPVTSAEIDQLIISLSKQLGVTSVVVTHEMDSAFAIADRMCMLDKGKMLLVEQRQYFEQLRDSTGPQDETGLLVRQFLRGEPQGPLTQRRQATNYVEDLLGEASLLMAPRPSVQTTR